MINSVRNLCSNNYILYGLYIRSEIPLPELIVAENREFMNSDVTITYGSVPRVIREAVIDGEYIKLSRNEFYLYIKGIAHYYVFDGCRIIVEPEEQSDMEEMRVFLLGSCFGLLLTQRNIIAIHGGAIVIDGQGIVITGQTGAGKSTLTSAFRKMGYSFLADDVSALLKDLNSVLMIQPSYPQAKLCRDAMVKLGYDPNKFRVTDPYRDKFAIPSRSNFIDCPVILAGIYEITTGDVDKVEITEVLGSEKIALILRNIYRIEISRALGFGSEYFRQCLEIASTITIYRITRPKNSFTVEEQVRLIMETLDTATKNVVLSNKYI